MHPALWSTLHNGTDGQTDPRTDEYDGERSAVHLTLGADGYCLTYSSPERLRERYARCFTSTLARLLKSLSSVGNLRARARANSLAINTCAILTFVRRR